MEMNDRVRKGRLCFDHMRPQQGHLPTHKSSLPAERRSAVSPVEPISVELSNHRAAVSGRNNTPSAAFAMQILQSQHDLTQFLRARRPVG